jgi:hypothetical protein
MPEDLTKHTTAQVVAVLSKHHDWTAKAPNTDEFFPCSASTDGIHIEFITDYPKDDGYDRNGAAPNRSDWTIRRADGSIVERRPRRKRVVVGKVKYSSAPMVNNWWIEKQGFDNLDKSKTYELVAVEE